jgi:3-hydroxybutyryl-CoA dehydrogenase
MGAGIAIVAARPGFSTICYDVAMPALERTARQTEGFFAKSVERGKMSAADKDAVMGRLSRTTSLEDLAKADLVIEAVFEDLAVKRELFGKLNKICPAETIFASNTSTLSITEIAGASGRDDRVVGLHFWPAGAADEADRGVARHGHVGGDLQHGWAGARRPGQLPVKTQDKPGFILNALLIPFNNDCIRAVEAGVASAADVDTAIKRRSATRWGRWSWSTWSGSIRRCGCARRSIPSRSIRARRRRRCCAAWWRWLAGAQDGRGFFKYDGNAMFGG